VLLFALLGPVFGCGRIDIDPTSAPEAPLDGATGMGGGNGGNGGIAMACASGGIACPTGQYCSKPVGMCSAVGTCTAKPAASEVCPDIIVCGCDGKMYGTPCDAARAGESLAAIGNCTAAQ
jgi:hypothetical protein